MIHNSPWYKPVKDYQCGPAVVCSNPAPYQEIKSIRHLSIEFRSDPQDPVHGCAWCIPAASGSFQVYHIWASLAAFAVGFCLPEVAFTAVPFASKQQILQFATDSTMIRDDTLQIMEVIMADLARSLRFDRIYELWNRTTQTKIFEKKHTNWW